MAVNRIEITIRKANLSGLQLPAGSLPAVQQVI